MKRDELRQELLATLAAGRELPSETDEHVVEGLLARIEAAEPTKHGLAELRALLCAMIPVKWPALAGIALIHAALLFVIAEYMVKRVYGFYSYSEGYAQTWEMFAIIWLLQVVLTVVTIAAASRRTEGGTRPRRRQRVSRTRTALD